MVVSATVRTVRYGTCKPELKTVVEGEGEA